jgi:hypothetical protein
MDLTPVGYTPPPFDVESVSETNPSRAVHDEDERKDIVKNNKKDEEKSGKQDDQHSDYYEHETETDQDTELAANIKPKQLKELPGDEAGQLIDVSV